MRITAEILKKYGAPVNHVLRLILEAPDHRLSLQALHKAPWRFLSPQPSAASLQKTVHDLVYKHRLLVREHRGVYRLAPGVTFTQDAIQHVDFILKANSSRKF